MFNTILFPTDGSPLSDKAAESALAFAQLNKAKLVALSVVQPFPFSPMADGGIVLDAGLYEQQMQEASQRAVDKIGEAARAVGVPFEGVVVVSPSPHEEIVNAAQTYHCDIILMASHGRNRLVDRLIGSVATRLLETVPNDLLVVRTGGLKLFEHGAPVAVEKRAAEKAFAQPNVVVELDVGLGGCSDFFLSSGLTEAYVRLNADYTT